MVLQYSLSVDVFQWLNTLDSKEIYNQVISYLPDLELLTSENFEVHKVHTCTYSTQRTLKHTPQLCSSDVHYCCSYIHPIVYVTCFQSKLARHRWLVSFTFANRNPASKEYKKLLAFLRNDHIQVYVCFACLSACTSHYLT